MIYLKLEKEPETLKDLLANGFCEYNGKFVRTYSDERCEVEQCHMANRSFGDLLEIANTYFPETSEMDLAKVLYELWEEIDIVGIYCPDINRPVFYKRNSTSKPYLKTFNMYEEPNQINSYMLESERIRKSNNRGLAKYSLHELVLLSEGKEVILQNETGREGGG